MKCSQRDSHSLTVGLGLCARSTVDKLKGDFYRIPANVPHEDTCFGEKPFIVLDIFYPVREDFIQKLMGHTPV